MSDHMPYGAQTLVIPFTIVRTNIPTEQPRPEPDERDRPEEPSPD